MGLAKRRDESSHLTNTSQGIGTPYYMPYEQAMNARLADERSDIYALGSTLYHLITGEVPFPGESSLEIVEKKGLGVYAPAGVLQPNVPEALDDILTRMLARDPQDRYQTVSQLIVDLDRAHLAATIPSFINRDLALQDPVVRKQWTAPVAPTSPDLQLQQAVKQADKAAEPWFLRYEDQQGNLCKSRVTTAEILDRLRQGKLAPRAEAARSLQGEYKPLEKWPEFARTVASLRMRRKADQRQGVVRAAPAPAAQPLAGALAQAARWWWLLAGGALGMVLLVLIFSTLYMLWHS
jgi:serine/threonine protein kinase